MGRLESLRTVDPVLTELARGYTNATYVAESLFPVVVVDKEAGVIPQFGKEAFKIYTTERALRGATNQVRPEDRTTIEFVLKEHDLAYPVDYREAEEDVMSLEQHAALTVADAVKLRMEYLAAALATTDGSYASGNYAALTSTSKFSDQDGIDPAYTVDLAKEVVRGKIGKLPNVMVMGAATFNALKFHEKIISKIQYSMKGVVTLDILKEIFDMQKVFVGSAVYSTDAGVFTYVWGDSLVLAYVPESSASRTVYEPSFGYTLRKRSQPTVDSYKSNDGKQTFYRYTDIALAKVVGNEAGYHMSDCV